MAPLREEVNRTPCTRGQLLLDADVVEQALATAEVHRRSMSLPSPSSPRAADPNRRSRVMSFFAWKRARVLSSKSMNGI